MSWFSRKQKESEKGKNASAANQSQPALPTPSAPRHDNADAYRAIIGPYVTEKATIMHGTGSYVFRVSDQSTKDQIKKGIEALYKVGVVSVRTLRLPSKVRTVGRHVGVKPGFKKAIVRLKSGDTIDVIS